MRIRIPTSPKPGAGYDKHHVYGGSRRKASEKWGAYVFLPHMMHLYGEFSPHANPEVARELHEEFQRRFEYHGWTRAEFMETFGKNYLEAEDESDRNEHSEI